jgi:hypothetical protein
MCWMRGARCGVAPSIHDNVVPEAVAWLIHVPRADLVRAWRDCYASRVVVYALR